MKVGEIFTTERIVMGGTGYCYAPVRLTGEVALLNSEIVPIETGKCGAPEIHRFTFQFLRPGKAEIQFARFRSFDLSDAIYEDVLPFQVEPAGDTNAIVPGSWSPFKALNDEEKQIFDKALKGLVGVVYTPEKVSSQVVAGVNYRFFCHAVTVTREEHKFHAIVKIHVALSGEAQITDIQRVVL